MQNFTFFVYSLNEMKCYVALIILLNFANMFKILFREKSDMVKNCDIHARINCNHVTIYPFKNNYHVSFWRINEFFITNWKMLNWNNGVNFLSECSFNLSIFNPIFVNKKCSSKAVNLGSNRKKVQDVFIKVNITQQSH